MLEKIKKIDAIKLTIIVGLYYLIGLNFTLVSKIYNILNISEGLSVAFIISVPIFFLVVFIFIFTPFISKFIAKPILIFFLITSSAINYGAYNFGIIFNQDMMLNIFETTTKEASSYLNIKLAIWLFITGILPSIYLLIVKIEYKPFLKEVLRKLSLMVFCLFVVLVIALFFYKDYASIVRNNPKLQKDIIPTYYIANSFKYIKNTFFNTKIPYKKLGTDAVRIQDSKDEKYLFIVIIGETARAKNYQFNGYGKKTNFYTSNIENLIYFNNVISCGTATAVSLPCMFSMMNRKNYSRHKFNFQDNLLDIIKNAGYRQIWIDNNTGCKGICKNIESYATSKISKLNCKGEDCTDAIFLDIFDEKVKSINGDDGVIYLHLLGSHGPTYYKRYPKDFSNFEPTCNTSDLQNCTKEEIVNTYDNTILFTDFVMAKIIEKIKRYTDNYYVSVIYISDHGESLGEKGLYLHGMPYAIAPDEQTHIPFMMWFSKNMIKHKKFDIECIKNKAKTGVFSHDNLSHTILYLLDIKTKEYDNTKNIFETCKKVN